MPTESLPEIGTGAIKVTLTRPEELPAVIDRYVASCQGVTRSGMCAEALHGWLRARHEAEIAHYYRTFSDEERAEDAAWASLAARSADRLRP